MRIEGPKSAAETSAKKAAGKTDQASGFGALLGAGEPKAKTETRSTSLVSDISSLIAVQAADDIDQRQKRKRMRGRGEALLKQLDSIRLNLMSGSVTLQHLQELDTLLEQSREQIEDQALQAVLDEIELRAAVERAKLEQARDNNF